MTTDTARLIAYHDTMCSPNCGDDISTYPTPPDDWSRPMSEYTPTEHEVRLVWSEWSSYGGLTDRPDYDATRTEMRAEFGRFIARVRRDAAREALDGLAAELMEVARDCALGGDHRGAVAWRNASAHTHHHRDTHYPETEDQT